MLMQPQCHTLLHTLLDNTQNMEAAGESADGHMHAS